MYDDKFKERGGKVHAQRHGEELYWYNSLQRLPINTTFQYIEGENHGFWRIRKRDFRYSVYPAWTYNLVQGYPGTPQRYSKAHAKTNSSSIRAPISRHEAENLILTGDEQSYLIDLS
eukprot:1436295-Rhodomonas_salina.2